MLDEAINYILAQNVSTIIKMKIKAITYGNQLAYTIWIDVNTDVDKSFYRNYIP